MLTDKRLNNGESLTGTGSADNPCATERIGDVYPSLTELALIVIAHGDIDRISVLDLLLTLLEALVFKVEPVFEQTFLQELGDIVESHMDENGAEHTRRHIHPNVQTEGKKYRHNPVSEKPQ